MPARQPGNRFNQPVGNPRGYGAPSGYAPGLGAGSRRPAGSALRTAMRRRALQASHGSKGGSKARIGGPTLRARLKAGNKLANTGSAAGRSGPAKTNNSRRKSTVSSFRRGLTY